MFERAGALLDRMGLRRLLGDRRGVAAVEFAFIAPVLLSLYFVTMEVAQGIETNKKVSRVGSMVADLVTQQQSITKSELEAIMTIGSSILQPYNRSKPKIIITAIEITNETTPKVKVVWSRKLVNGTYSVDAAAGTITTVPSKLIVKGSFLVRVESSLSYSPVITWSASQKEGLGLTAAFDGISMKESYYLRPRMSTSIPCSNC
ncbi:MAG: pilus assembly protein [Rhizobiaceae bacterium]|nr:pilus assembly protein [Rhizobiaceae bacterium]